MTLLVGRYVDLLLALKIHADSSFRQVTLLGIYLSKMSEM